MLVQQHELAIADVVVDRWVNVHGFVLRDVQPRAERRCAPATLQADLLYNAVPASAQLFASSVALMVHVQGHELPVQALEAVLGRLDDDGFRLVVGFAISPGKLCGVQLQSKLCVQATHTSPLSLNKPCTTLVLKLNWNWHSTSLRGMGAGSGDTASVVRCGE